MSSNADTTSLPSDVDAAPFRMHREQSLQAKAPEAEALLRQPVSKTKSTTNPSRRREKPQLSCTLCRKRKLRCDRKQPCSSCASRDIPCTYVEGGAGVAGPGLHDRLVQLERLIMLQIPLSQAQAQAQGQNKRTATATATQRTSTHTADPEDGATDRRDAPSRDVPSEQGSLHVGVGGDSELRYVGGGHWAAILDNITDLKHQLDREEDVMLEPIGDLNDSDSGPGTAAHKPEAASRRALLLYSCPQPASREDILAALPPKVTVDRYLSRYFTCLDLASCSIHGPSFLQEYEAFWSDPSQTSIIWVSLLFGIICLAVTTSDLVEASAGHERDLTLRQVDLYVEKIVQCLVLGQYTHAGEYVVESLVHYLHVEFAICTDASKDVWLVLALAIKIATSMGYHRDPSHFPKLTPLQAEMRRRVWATLLLADVLISSQMGMPRMISDSQWDTAEPQNLHDDDLSPEMTRLPPPRPETEHTTSLGIIARIRILRAVGKISDLTSAVAPCSYAEITRLDGLLQDARATIPQLLQPKSLAASITDSPQVIMARLFLSQLFYKGKIMLHRRFLYLEPAPQEQESYRYSRGACLDAALGLLEIQLIMDEETGATGQLHTMRWRLSSSLNHQFLTATMLLCSLLHRGITLGRNGEIVSALKTSRGIWTRHRGNSLEARKAAWSISIVLARALRDSKETPGVGVRPDGVQSLSWPMEQPNPINQDGGQDFDARQMLNELVRPDAEVPFQPDVFAGYTPRMMQDEGPFIFPSTQDAPDAQLEWFLGEY